MTSKEISIKLREDARRLGLCDEWYGKWKDDSSLQELIDKFKRGNDFCFSKRWPSLSFIKKHFPQTLLRQNGILVDDTYSYPVRNPETRRLVYIRDYVLFGDSRSTIRYSFSKHSSNVWVRDTSRLKVDVKYGAFILVHLFDKATVEVKTDLVSKVCVIKHSAESVIIKDGVVTVRNEYNYLK